MSDETTAKTQPRRTGLPASDTTTFTVRLTEEQVRWLSREVAVQNITAASVVRGLIDRARGASQ